MLKRSMSGPSPDPDSDGVPAVRAAPRRRRDWRLPGHRIALKFLFVMMPAAVLAAAIVTALFSRSHFLEAREHLLESAAAIAQVDAVALAGPIAEGNRRTTRNILHAIVAREEIACAAVADEVSGLMLIDGAVTERGGPACTGVLTSPPDVAVPIRRGDRRLGGLALVLNDAAAWSGIGTGLVHAGLLFATILAVSVASALLALRAAVMRPLMRLHRSIGHAGAGSGWRPVRWSSQDEIGDLVAVYNRMIRDVAQREAAQAESEAGLRAIIEAAPYPIVITRRRDSRIMFINRRTAEVVGLAPEAMVGRYAPNFYADPDERVRMLQIIAEHGSVVDFEVQHLTGDGRTYWALMSGAFLTYLGEEALFVSFIDISERKRAEQQIRNQLAFQRSLIETMPYPIFYKGTDLRFLGCNTAFARDIAGSAVADIVGKRTTDLRKPDEARLFEDSNRDLLAGGGHRVMEVPITYADGSRHDVIVKTGTFADADGRTAGIIGVIVDITDRKRAERELARETAILEATLENVAQGIVMVDGECRVVAHNRRYLALTGLPARLLDGRPRVDEVLRRQGEHGIPFSGLEPPAQESRPAPCGAAGALTLEHVLADGTVLSIVSTALPDGGCVRTFSDVTVRKEAERRLEQQAQDLAVTAVQLEAERRRAETARTAAEDANRAKSDFLATMSHELRTPLNAILGFSEILKDRPFGDMDADRIAEYAGDIHTSGVHLLTLINDVLDLAKIESGKLEIDPVAVDLEDLLGAATRLLAVRAEIRGLKLRLEVPTPAPALEADERAVKQIAFNLLSNAIKFTPPGGTVTVRAKVDPDGGAAIVVADTGCGIPADQIERVLRPFEQAQNTFAGGAGGTGLGLALVQALAELHGGRVAMDSTVGVGTTVTVHLPARPAVPQPPGMAAARA